jgi:hypothetical protein
VHRRAAADATGHYERAVIALTLEPSVDEHRRVIVRERPQHRDEEANIHDGPRPGAGLVPDEPRKHEGGSWTAPGSASSGCRGSDASFR